MIILAVCELFEKPRADNRIPEDIWQLLVAINRFISNEALSDLRWPDLLTVIEFEQTLITNTAYGTVLPILMCLAVGGEEEVAVPLAAAWLLYDLASDIFDDLQDRDGKERPWNNWELARGMNVGLGIIAVANKCLAGLQITHEAHQDILYSWSHAFALAAQGQTHAPEQLSLQNYFRQTVAKSGLIYAAVARAGARLGTHDKPLLDAAHDYGYALGMLIQIIDDCRDLSPHPVTSDLVNGIYTLPVLLTMSQHGPENRLELSTLLTSSGSLSPSAAQKVLDIVSNTGAIPHSLAFAKFYEQKALAALEKLLPGRVGHLSTYASHFLSNIKI